MTRAEDWAAALEEWAIPQPILDAAPESPWTFPVELFARRAEAATRLSTPSRERALEALPDGGTVLDVGCGAGAGGLALAPPATRVIGVDASEGMLAAFRERAAAAGVACDTVQGAWPDVAPGVPVADVVVCHNVLYNVADLVPFARALTDHARRRVIVEMTPTHPTSNLSPLWRRFHGIERPTGPTAEDAVEVLREAGLAPRRADWRAPAVGTFARREDLVAWVRRRLCLPAGRDADVLEAIRGAILERDGLFALGDARDLVTLWWEGSAPG